MLCVRSVLLSACAAGIISSCIRFCFSCIFSVLTFVRHSASRDEIMDVDHVLSTFLLLCIIHSLVYHTLWALATADDHSVMQRLLEFVMYFTCSWSSLIHRWCSSSDLLCFRLPFVIPFTTFGTSCRAPPAPQEISQGKEKPVHLLLTFVVHTYIIFPLFRSNLLSCGSHI